jgi:hypothetical protein
VPKTAPSAQRYPIKEPVKNFKSTLIVAIMSALRDSTHAASKSAEARLKFTAVMSWLKNVACVSDSVDLLDDIADLAEVRFPHSCFLICAPMTFRGDCSIPPSPLLKKYSRVPPFSCVVVIRC